MKPIIDISSWQNPRNISYDKLAAAVSGVIIRATYGSRKDAYFEQHYAEFKKRGVPVGVYGFITEYMPVEDQVFAFVLMCEGKTFELGYWGDVEAEAGAELLILPTIRAWLTQADAKLKTCCGIYTSWWMWQACAKNSLDFGNRPLWAAHYGVASPRLPTGWTTWLFHQFSSTYFHPGYNYVLDTNRFNGDDAKFAAFIASNTGGVVPLPPVIKPLWKGLVIPEIGLNVRSGKNFLNNVLTTLPQGTKVYVYEESGTWARISLDEQQWVAARFLERIKEGDPIPSETTPTLWKGKVNGSLGLYVRNMPAKSGRVLRGLVFGTTVDVYQVSGTWARISPTSPEWVYIAPDCLVKIGIAPVPPVIVIPPASGSAIDIDSFPCFSQRDPRWASDKLGTSDSSMGGWGCVVTSHAAVYKYLGIDIDPGRLNKLMIEWDGYDDTNLWRWWTPELHLPVKWEREPKGTTARERIELVRSLTSKGIPPVLCVDFQLATSDLQSHFVVGLGVTAENDVIIMDSWDGQIKSFKSTYGNPLWGIWRVDVSKRKSE